MNKFKVSEFAKKCGYEEVEYIGVFEGYDVYRPVYKEFRLRGKPTFIITKGDEIRSVTSELGLKIFYYFYDNEA